MDEKDIETGATIDDSIAQQMRDADEVLLLLSPASLKSTWVLMELGGAKVLRKKIAPILHHVGVNEVPQPISHALCRDLNDVEKYYDEIALRILQRDENVKTEMSNMGLILQENNRINNVMRRRVISAGDKIRIKESNLVKPASKQKHPVWVEEMDVLSNCEDVVSFVAENGMFYVKNNDWAWIPEWVDFT